MPARTTATVKTTAPSSFSLRALPGVVGALVMLHRPDDKHAPSTITARFHDAIERSLPYSPIDSTANDPRHAASAKVYLDALPEVITPVAALGIAVREATAPDHRWQHVRTADKASRWTYCAANVTETAVSIHGAGTSAEAYPDGRLDVEPGVPHDIAVQLRASYDAARGVVEPSRVIALACAHLVRQGARRITSDVYLVPDVDPVTCGVLAGLVDLGGWAETVPVADPKRIARLSSPVAKSIEEQIADVVAATETFIAKATEVAKPGSEAAMKSTTVDTVRESIAAARSAATMWRDRLSLASLDVDAQLDALDLDAQRADAEALAAMEARRAEKAAQRKAAKDATKVAATIAALECNADMGSKTPGAGGSTCVLPHGHAGPHDDGDGYLVDHNGHHVTRRAPAPSAAPARAGGAM